MPEITYKTNTEGNIVSPIPLFHGCIINIPDSMGLPQYFQVKEVVDKMAVLEPYSVQAINVKPIW